MIKENKRNTMREVIKNILALIILTLIVLFGIKNIASVAKSAENLTDLPSTSWMALIGVVLGQIISLYIRIFEKIIDKKEESTQNRKMVESIINNFLSKEINDNFKLIPINSIKGALKAFRENAKYKTFGFLTVTLQFKEYDRIKYEIIKYNNELTLQVLEIYNLFYLMNGKKDTENMSIEEMEKIVTIYDKYVDEYKKIK